MSNAHFIHSMSIRKKLLLLLAAVFLPAVAVIVASGWEQHQRELQEASKKVALMAENLAAQQEKITLGARFILETLAHSSELQSLDADACTRLFQEISGIHPSIAIVGAATPDGRLFAASMPFIPGRVNLSDRKHFKDAMNTRCFAVGEYIVGRVSNTSSINYAYPVIDAKDNVIAVVIAAFRLDGYSRFIESGGLPSGSVMVITDYRGVRLYRFPSGPKDLVGLPIPESSFAEISGKSVNGVYEIKGQDDIVRVYGFKQLRLGEGEPPYMYILVGLPVEAIAKTVTMKTLIYLTALGVPVILLSCLGWFLGASLFIRPVNRLMEAAQRLAKGELESPEELPPTDDELGQLTMAFNDMASQLAMREAEQRRAYEELRANEEKYRRLFENELIAISIIDLETLRFLDVNEAHVRLYGYDRQECLEGLTIEDLSAEREKSRRDVESAADGGAFHIPLKWHRKKDGSLFPVEVVGGVYMIRERSVIIWMAFDLTERKRAEQLLRESEEQLRLVLEGADLGMWDRNVEMGQVVYDNRYAEMLGYSLEELGSRPWEKLVHPEDRQRAMDLWIEHLKGESSCYESEHRLQSKSGEWIWVLSKGKVMQRDEHGRPIRVVGTQANITERKKAEEQYRQWEQQRRQLMKTESLKRMAGAVAHHFNNKLMAVMGNLELAQLCLEPEHETAPMLEAARQASRDAAEVSSLMLAYLGQTPIRLVPVNLADACLEATEAQKLIIPGKISLETEIEQEGLTIRGNHAKIVQILSSLLNNAREAIGDDEGSIRIVIREVGAQDVVYHHVVPAGWKPESGVYVCLEVSDTGCGIKEEEMDLLFDPFFSTKFTGRGLGLAALLGAVRLHRGAVAVTSDPGSGSVFRVFFPIEEQWIRTAAESMQKRAEELETLGLALCVDDDPQVLATAKRLLRLLGFTVLLARNGFEAVEIFRKRREDLQFILLDLTMPGMDGWETLAELRALRGDDIPVILTSGNDESQVMNSEHSEFPRAFLHKPYSLRELQAAVRATLKGRGAWVEKGDSA